MSKSKNQAFTYLISPYELAIKVLLSQVRDMKTEAQGVSVAHPQVPQAL